MDELIDWIIEKNKAGWVAPAALKTRWLRGAADTPFGGLGFVYGDHAPPVMSTDCSMNSAVPNYLIDRNFYFTAPAAAGTTLSRYQFTVRANPSSNLTKVL